MPWPATRPRPISLRLARVSCSGLRVRSAEGSAGCLFAASALAGRSATGLARATSAPGLGSPLPLRHSACLCRPGRARVRTGGGEPVDLRRRDGHVGAPRPLGEHHAHARRSARGLPSWHVRTSDRVVGVRVAPVPVLVRPLRPARAGEKEFLLFRPAEEANLHYESVRPPMYECLPRLAA